MIHDFLTKILQIGSSSRFKQIDASFSQESMNFVVFELGWIKMDVHRR